ncbi:MAG: DUF1697 domain-containing protein [Balneolaceae bacterium]
MEELRDLLHECGFEQVKTYIQSGNVVFRSAQDDPSVLPDTVSKAVKNSHGFEPRVWILPVDEFTQAVEKNPYGHATERPKALHLFFLSAKPEDPDREGLEALRSETEEFEIRGRVFYLYAPDGIGRSKLAAKVEKLLGVQTTSRNWRTVSKIAEMIND